MDSWSLLPKLKYPPIAVGIFNLTPPRLFGATIRKYRRKKGWSQEKLAFEANLHRAYIGQIERGEKNIGIKNIEKIAKALNVSLKQLMP